MSALTQTCRRFWRDRGPGGSGQAVVEFAIAFPLQLFITFGLMQLALIAIATLMVNYASYCAARAALVGEDPARAALVALSPLGGPTSVPPRGIDDNREPFAEGLRLPGWGILNGSANAARKIHVRVNDKSTPFTPGLSRFTLRDAEAYDDDLRFDDDALRARERIREALGTRRDVRVVVEFDYELIFPLVDGLLEVFLRPADTGADARAFGREDDGASAGGDYAWIYEPGQGYRDRGRVRTLGGAKHLVIARECSLYRGFAME